MFRSTIVVLFPAMKLRRKVRLLGSLDEIVVWQAEWIQLGFTIVQLNSPELVEPTPDTQSLAPRLPPASKAGPKPDGDSYFDFCHWWTLTAVERLRASRRWLAQHQVCADVDPPYEA
jgi:hypothetical protein